LIQNQYHQYAGMINNLKSEMGSEIRSEINGLRNEINNLGSEMRNDINGLRNDIYGINHNIYLMR
jgi:archaellum component FlaC